jgi:hypothetical protein
MLRLPEKWYPSIPRSSILVRWFEYPGSRVLRMAEAVTIRHGPLTFRLSSLATTHEAILYFTVDELALISRGLQETGYQVDFMLWEIVALRRCRST